VSQATILIVDDFPANRMLLKAVLQQEGYHVIEASDGAQALQIIEDHSVDVIISDILMPGMDGYRLCTEIRRRDQLDAVGFMFHTSTYNSPNDEAFARELGADRFLRKPVPSRAIVEAIEQIVNEPRTHRPIHRNNGANMIVTAEYTQRLVAKLEEKNDELHERTQEARRTSETLRALILAAPVGISSCDSEGIVRVWNPAAERIFGWKASEVIGRPMAEVFCELGADAGGLEAEPGGTIHEQKFTLRRRDGATVYTEISISPVYNAEGLGLGQIAIYSDITERSRVEIALKQAKARMETLSRQLLAVGEAERLKIARELHDDIGQGLTAAKMAIEAAKEVGNASQRSLCLDDGIAVIGHLLQMVRALSLDLRPASLDELGLVTALRAHVVSQAQRSGLDISFEADELPRNTNGETEIACFRVAQEALNNILRHAHATRAEIALRRQNGEVRLSVSDNGRGFDADSAPAIEAETHSGFGLLSMRERVQLAGGRFAINSQPGAGTKIESIFPWHTDGKKQN
jgi:PAS domain S-box-containing protein